MLGGLTGGLVGIVIGFILGLLFEIGSCTYHVFNRSYQEKKYSGIIFITSSVICGVIPM